MNNAVLGRASSLARRKWHERRDLLIKEIQSIRASMNQRGVWFSTVHIRAVCEICAVEARHMAQVAWESFQKAHESLGAPQPYDFETHTATMDSLLTQRLQDLQKVQDEYVTPIAEQLGNKTMYEPLLLHLRTTFDELRPGYKVEMFTYLDEVRRKRAQEDTFIRKHGMTLLIAIAGSLLTAALAYYYGLAK